MCNPAAVAGVSAAWSIYQQTTNASAMEKYGKAQFKANEAAATDDAILSYASLQARQTQEHAKAAQAIDQASLETKRRAATSLASAGESGVAGNVAVNLANEFQRTELNYQTTVLRNQAMLDTQFQGELAGVWAQERGRIQAGVPNPVQQPDILGTALAGFGQILAINQQQKQLKPVK